jgi:hypothetical protein
VAFLLNVQFAEPHAEQLRAKSRKSLENKGFSRFYGVLSGNNTNAFAKKQRAEKPCKIKGFRLFHFSIQS